MNQAITDAAGGYLAPKIMRGFRLRWLVYGAAAYYALRFMSKRGIFPNQADAALNAIDNGLAAIKSRVGLGQEQAVSPTVH
jgi:hypothetical protein